MSKPRRPQISTAPVDYAAIGVSLFNVPALPAPAVAEPAADPSFGDPVILTPPRGARQVDTDQVFDAARASSAPDRFAQFVAALLCRYASIGDGAALEEGVYSLLGLAGHRRLQSGDDPEIAADIWQTPSGVTLVAFRGESNKVMTVCPSADINSLDAGQWGAGVQMVPVGGSSNYEVSSLSARAAKAIALLNAAIKPGATGGGGDLVFMGFGAGGVEAWYAAAQWNKAATGFVGPTNLVRRVITFSEWPLFGVGATALDDFYTCPHFRVLAKGDPVAGALTAGVMLNNVERILKGSTRLLDYVIPDYGYGDQEISVGEGGDKAVEGINSLARSMVSTTRLYATGREPVRGPFGVYSGGSSAGNLVAVSRNTVVTLIQAAGGKDGDGALGPKGEYGTRAYCSRLEAACKASGSVPYPLFTRAVALARLLDGVIKDAA